MRCFPAVFADGLHLRLDLVVQLEQKPGSAQACSRSQQQRQIVGPALKKLDPIVLPAARIWAAERLLGDKQAFRLHQFFCGVTINTSACRRFIPASRPCGFPVFYVEYT